MTQQTENNSQGLMIELKDMNKWYGEFHVLKNINLEVKKARKSLSVALQALVNQR